MKKSIVSILVSVCSFAFVNAQTVEEALKSTLLQFQSASDQEGRIASSNRFILIAKKWSNDWATHYYAGYANAIIGALERGIAKKTIYLDEAEKHLEAAKSNSTIENDEVFALTAMVASMKIGVYPDQWQKYGELFAENIKRAKQIRKENPRIYYIEGTYKFYTPEAYGGGKGAALIYFEKANEYFKLEANADIRKPSWGKKQNEEMLKKCSE